MYRQGWLDAMPKVSVAELLAKRVLSMKLIYGHSCPTHSLCIYCDAVKIALQIEGRSRAR